MTNASEKHWTKWPLAVWEGLLFGWFLFVGYIAAMNVNQTAEFFWHPRPEDKLPRLTIWIRDAMPDESWSLFTGWVTASIGFGLISLASKEPFSGRVFRWVIIGSMTTFVALAIPIMAQFQNLSGGPDEIVWDEILVACLGLCMLTCGVMRVRSTSVLSS